MIAETIAWAVVIIEEVPKLRRELVVLLFQRKMIFYFLVWSGAPVSSNGAEMDLLGSLSDSFSNPLAIMPVTSGTTATDGNASVNFSSGPTFGATPSASSVTNQVGYASKAGNLWTSSLLELVKVISFVKASIGIYY